jgi:hypothetical protein
VFGVLRLLACHGGEGVTELITCFFFFGSVLVLVLLFVASCYVASSSSWLHGGGWIWRGDGVLFVWFADRDWPFLVELCWCLDGARSFANGSSLRRLSAACPAPRRNLWLDVSRSCLLPPFGADLLLLLWPKWLCPRCWGGGRRRTRSSVSWRRKSGPDRVQVLMRGPLCLFQALVVISYLFWVSL